MATVSFNSTFNYATSKLQFLDTTDWAGEGVPKENCYGNFKVVTPNGLTYYNNTSVVAVTGTATSSSSLNITLDGSETTNDFYKNLYIRITSGAGSGQVRRVTSYNGISGVANIDTAWTTNPGAADYEMVLSDIYLEANLNNQIPITVPLTSDGKPYNGTYEVTYTVFNFIAVETYTLVKTFEICHVTPTVEITQTVDCLSPLFTSLDDTNYIVDSITPTISRTHTVYYPAASPLVGTAAEAKTGVFYTGVQSTTIFSKLTYDLTGGIYVYDEVTGSETINVECDARLCDIFCCVITVYNKMNKYKGKNDTLYNEYLVDFTQVMSLVTLAREAWNCGKDDKINTILADILDIAECETGCGCSDGTPQQVIGLGSTVAFSEVQSNSPYILVTPSVVGNVTTYYVTLDPTWVSTVNSSYGTIVSTATPTYLDITETGSNPKTYNIDFVPGAFDPPLDEISFKVFIDYTDLGNFITIENEEIQPSTGSNFQSPTVTSVVTPGMTSNFLNSSAVFNVTNFMVTPDDNFKVFLTAELVSLFVNGQDTETNPGLLSFLSGFFKAQLNYVQSGSFQIGLFQSDLMGILLNGPLNKSYGAKLYIHVLIKK